MHPPTPVSDPVVNAASLTWLNRQNLLIAGLTLVSAWTFWPVLRDLAAVWDREADYSHGYLVGPIAVAFLWLRREEFPGAASKVSWAGLALMCLGLVGFVGSAVYYLDFLGGWSLLVWLAGTVWFLGGGKCLRWALPSIVFLWFAIPLPFRVETAVSQPLQRIATRLSTTALQMLGQPAIAEGNTILLGDQHLEVEQACSGLRIFMGIGALAFAYVLFARRPWWEKAIVVVGIVPVALAANAVRIVATGLLYQFASSATAQKFSHDISGWLSIPLAAAMFAAMLWYLSCLFREVEQVDVSQSVARTLQ